LQSPGDFDEIKRGAVQGDKAVMTVIEKCPYCGETYSYTIEDGKVVDCRRIKETNIPLTT